MSKIDDMEQTIQTIKGDNEELMKENLSLKRQVASYKSANTNYRKKVAQLKERVEHYKSLGIEGDGLYEQKIKELEDAQREIRSLRSFRNDLVPIAKVKELEESIENKNQFIEQLQEKVQELKIQLCDAESRNDSLKSIIDELDETVDKLSKPWWRKLF